MCVCVCLCVCVPARLTVPASFCSLSLVEFLLLIRGLKLVGSRLKVMSSVLRNEFIPTHTHTHTQCKLKCLQDVSWYTQLLCVRARACAPACMHAWCVCVS